MSVVLPPDRSPSVATSSPAALVEPARLSPSEFGDLVDPYRRELLVHCYRMLGSLDDAEDAVQETLTKAWRARATYQPTGTFRAWLYRIATNTCLDAIARRARRRGREVSLGVGPIPDTLLGAPVEAGPDARIDARESVSLAFLAALQALPPRQRATLILRDVLGWHASEVATLLGVSVPAANSALQRARRTLAERPEATRHVADRPAPRAGSALRSLLDRYVRTWEAGDVAGLVALLREDAVLGMPPRPMVVGAEAIGAFLAAEIFRDGARRRLMPTAANARPAFVLEIGPTSGGPLRPWAVLVLDVADGAIARLDAFADPIIVRRFSSEAASG
jgi:RNA polymerase sigma-70 factor, ECF subfamily